MVTEFKSVRSMGGGMRSGGAVNAVGCAGSHPAFKRCVEGVPLFKGVERRRRAFGVPCARVRGSFRQSDRRCQDLVDLTVCDEFGIAL